jgi:rRNA-processing protein FCF1
MSAAPPDNGRMEILLADANVLIDMLNADALGLVGDLIRHDLATVHLPRIVYDEVSTVISESQIADLGIIILPVEIALMERVTRYHDTRLSIPDRSLLLMAMDKGYVVWSNDRRLRENCGANSVRTMWEFEVLRRLVERDFMSAADLVAVAARVEETNPYLSGITERLRCLLGFVKR